MFERFNTPEELFAYQLGAALTMERKLVEALEELEANAQREDIKKALSEHRRETIGHVGNVEECFKVLGQEPDDSPCPVVEALEKEAKSTIKKADEALVDVAVLCAAAESEHHEIAVYEALITQAEARGATEVVRLLVENLEQERHALEIATSALPTAVREGLAAGARA